jgi:hypothetical protein
MPTPSAQFQLSVSLGGDSFSACGKHDLVLKAFEDFKELTGQARDSLPSKGRGSATKTKPATGAANASLGGLPLPAYVKSLKLAGNKERATAILVWAAENGKDRLKTTEIESYWKTTHFKRPGNLGRDLGLAAKEGWIALEGKPPDQAWVVHGFGKEALASWGKSEAKG